MTAIVDIQKITGFYPTPSPAAAEEPSLVLAASQKVESVVGERLPKLAPAAAVAIASPVSFLDPKSERWTRDNFLKRIPLEERTVICQEIQRLLDDPSSKIPDAKSILTIDPHSPIDYRENNVYILHHYLQGNIDKFQASRLLLYDACREHVALAQKGSPEAAPVSIHHLVGPDSEESFRLLKEGFPKFFDEEDWERLKTVMKENPNKSWDFFAITHKLSEDRNASLFHRVHSRNRRLGFIPANNSKTATVLVIPPLLWTRMLESRFGKQTMKLDLILGHRRIERLSNTESRVVAVPCAFVKPPVHIHEYQATKITFYAHDAHYHLYIESSNPHRKLWVELAMQLRSECSRSYAESWLDRDFISYAGPAFANKPRTDKQKFWETMQEHTIYSNKDRLLIMNILLRELHSSLRDGFETIKSLDYITFGMKQWLQWLEAKIQEEEEERLRKQDPALLDYLKALDQPTHPSHAIGRWMEETRLAAKLRAKSQEPEEIQGPDVYSHGCFGL